ncbi:nicotinate (nicotinamide) nucleotide adenylyltransferase [candidate division WOR-3 bacterium]|uniref:Probable nicotinate-nucleotide adenylyltransferase n=1 Tax=candidate division WOR-3 bacterium TaxID=2052148 RepID=A0A7C0ZFF7_UNCW3|nr:nicotinate (nicotinamide) nucleotide adenylyltransferase [candidate division WOR-3 bacterium]HDI83382.1 nicotinate (nicotinamide) nucleotide adenylyltransferase [candidate division WOR-3 bacterium]
MIGIFGGTFDPIHTGHLILCRDVIELLGLKKIILVPAHVSPFKVGVETSTAEDRLKMVEIAIEHDPLLNVSDYEIKRGGVSYTIETINYLKNIYGEVCLLIGADQAKDFKKWHRWEEILKTTPVYVLKRKGFNFEHLEGMHSLDTRLIDISSTEIRNRVKEGRSIKYLVPERVEAYILDRGLYL